MDAQALLTLLSAQSLPEGVVSALETTSSISTRKKHSADPECSISKATSLTSILRSPISNPLQYPPKGALLSSAQKEHFPDPLFPPPEAAAYLGISENTLSVWRCVGRYSIEYIKVGRLVKYRKSALDTFLSRRTRGGLVS